MRNQITPPTSQDELQRRLRKYQKPNNGDWLIWLSLGIGVALAVVLSWKFSQDEILCKKRGGYLITTRISWVCIRKDALVNIDRPEMKIERVIH